MNSLENRSDSTYKSLAWQSYTHQSNVPTKFDMNYLVSFEVVQISSFEKNSWFQENLQPAVYKDSGKLHRSMTICVKFILR